MSAITREELAKIAAGVLGSQVSLLDERQPRDVVFVIFEPRVRTVLLTTPEDAARRLEAVGEPYEVTLAELRRDPAEVNNGIPGYFWVAAILAGFPYYSTIMATRRSLVDARAMN